jgi:Xaa-Pro dipeptidase
MNILLFITNKPKEENVMITRVILFLVAVMFTVPEAYAQVNYTADRNEVLRLIRKDKLDLVLPGAMRDNNVDMWIHVGRAGDPDPLEYEFGSLNGFLIFTDLGDRIERASFGGMFRRLGVPDIDVRGSTAIARAIAGYDYGNLDFSVYDELREFVEERDPRTIAVNYSDWLAVADGISYTQYVKLQKILGPKYAERMVSAENVITDFRTRRTLREVAVQVNTLEIARQRVMAKLASVKPGVTSVGDVGASVQYSAESDMSVTGSPHYVLQRGDLFHCGAGGSDWMDFGFSSFSVDTKTYGYILREGETRVPESLQYAYDQAIAGQWIMRPHMRVGMTAGESLEAMIKAMEDEGYIYTPFTDDGGEDRRLIREALANTDKSGFSIDNHAQGNNNGGLEAVGPSMAPFRRDRDHLVIQDNNIFAFEYMVHTNLPDRPGYPISFNISNVQIISNKGVEWIQTPNERIHLLH